MFKISLNTQYCDFTLLVLHVILYLVKYEC